MRTCEAQGRLHLPLPSSESYPRSTPLLFAEEPMAAASQPASPEQAAASAGSARRQPQSSPTAGSDPARPGTGEDEPGGGRAAATEAAARDVPAAPHGAIATTGTGRRGRRSRADPARKSRGHPHLRLAHTSLRLPFRRTGRRGCPRGRRWAGASPPAAQGPALASGLPHPAGRAQHSPARGAFAISRLSARSQAVGGRVRCSAAGPSRRASTPRSTAPSAPGGGPAPPTRLRR